eukprot:TRINITY_DN11171_c0_g1_i1.p1 TRINITY_DN11171_c0_g1~~TRINITY_DN11171_c0_g1_i1.p1  ORF type:complete len:990 (+),score=231.06 TRINITY_DN11171_c0_g1_i1:126-3095(+)
MAFFEATCCRPEDSERDDTGWEDAVALGDQIPGPKPRESIGMHAGGFACAPSSRPECKASDEMPMPAPDSEDEATLYSPRVFKPTEEPEDMSGWLLCYGSDQSSGSRLQAPRVAKATAGTPFGGLFWKKRFIQLKNAQLLCWAVDPHEEKDGKPIKVRGHKPRPVAVLPLSQLEEVAVDGKTLNLHVRGQKVSLQARAENEALASRWAAAVKAHAGAAISKSLPPGWDVEAMLSSGEGGSAAKLVNKEQLPASVNPAFQMLMDHCFVCKSTKDRRGNVVPMRLELVDVVRVQNGAAWMDYSKARTRIGDKAWADSWLERQVSETGSTTSTLTSAGSGHSSSTGTTDRSPTPGRMPLQFPVLTSSLNHAPLLQILGQTDEPCNEQWLFHGTSAAGVQGISDQEFRLDKAGSHRGTLFGKGVYFAECTTKADEYSEEDEDGYCWMLLCRVALGSTNICKDKKPPSDILEQTQAKGHDSLIGDRWAAVGTFREFILFDNNQVYPAFILRYKRWSEAAFCRSIRETAESGATQTARALFPMAAILAEEHPDSSVRYRLSLLLDAHAEAVVPILSRALFDPRRRVKLNATKALMNMIGQTSAVDTLPDGSLYRRQREGIPIVARAIPQLTNLLSDDDRLVRRAAARALERMGEHAASAVPRLIASLHDREDEVRAAVATALGQLGAAALMAIPSLVKSAEDPVERVRVAAMGALGHVGSQESNVVVPVIIARLEDSSAEVKSAACAALGMLGSTHATTAVEALAERLTDGEGHVRAAASRALGQIGGKAAGAIVPQLIPCLKDSDTTVRRATAVSLGRIGKHASSAAQHLADAIRDSNPQVREAAASSLSCLGIVEKIALTVCIQSLIKRGLTDTVSEVRQASALSLSDLARLEQLGNQKTAVEQAMTIRLKDENTKVRNIASTTLKLISVQEENSKKMKRKPKGSRARSASDRSGDRSEWLSGDEQDDGASSGEESALDLEELAKLVASVSKK